MIQDDSMYILFDYWYMHRYEMALFFEFVAKISTAYTLLFFSNLAPILDCANPYAYGTWTGGNDISVENSFVRIGLNTPFTFTNWYGSNPDDASTTELLDCVEIFYLGSWNDRPCPDFKPIICEK